MAQQGRSGAAFDKENMAKKWPRQRARWERGDGLGEPAGGRNGMPVERASAAASLPLRVSSASHGAEMVIDRNQKPVEIQKIWKNLFFNRPVESKGFRKRKDTTKK